jgi:tellurite resistance protein
MAPRYDLQSKPRDPGGQRRELDSDEADMAKLLNWLKATTIKAIDPNREIRLETLTQRVWEELRNQKQRFDFHQTLAAFGVDREDNNFIAERVFAHALDLAWKDGEITDAERSSLEMIGKLLHLPPSRTHDLRVQAGYPYFEAALTAAIADGQVDENEADGLARIAAGLGTTTREMVQAYFRDTGEDVMRILFVGSLSGRYFGHS